MKQHRAGAKCRAASYTFLIVCCKLLLTNLGPASVNFLPVNDPYTSFGGPSKGQCQGAEFKWDDGWIADSYPLPIHRPGSRYNPGYHLLSIDLVNANIRVRSKRCSGNTAALETSCSSCLGLGPEVDSMRAWSRERPGKKPSGRLSRNQLDHKLEAVNQKLRAEQAKTTNTRKYLTRARKRNNAHRVLLDLISTNDVPGLPRLLSTSKKEGWSPSKTTSKASLALQNKYHPRNYTALDKDLAILIYEL
ncbi:hypothetical protein R3P38DRAFT_2554025, partial [Favolaschia claudopus]